MLCVDARMKLTRQVHPPVDVQDIQVCLCILLGLHKNRLKSPS